MATAKALTDAQKASLTAAGIDWEKWLKKAKEALPLLIALVQILFEDTPRPVYGAVGHCTAIETLECALEKQICAAHCLSHALCELREHDHDH